MNEARTIIQLIPNLVSYRKQLGGKLGSSLQSELGVSTVGDLLQFSEEKLQERYGINTGSAFIIEHNSLSLPVSDITTDLFLKHF